MDVVVCLKRVPDTETKVKMAADGKSLDVAGVQWIMAPYDEIAVEKALQLRDAGGGGSVTVVSVGPAEASKELRTALAMGADKAVHVVTPAARATRPPRRRRSPTRSAGRSSTSSSAASRRPTRTTRRSARCSRRCSTCRAWRS